MPDVHQHDIKSFRSAIELGHWLQKNHAIKDELWIKIFKKRTGKPSVTWNDVVLETLCWGWIDGMKKSLGDEAYLQRITPRKPQSTWSKRNTEHVDRLIAQGRMQASGLVQVEAAKADGRWEKAYAPPSEMQIPKDFISALRNEPETSRYYESLSKSSRYAIAYGLETAKKAETRQRRFDKFLNMLRRQEAPGFGFKKKPKA